MEPEPPPQRLAVERSRSKLGEQAELDGAQQRLRAPEAEAELHDGIGRSDRFFHGVSRLIGWPHGRRRTAALTRGAHTGVKQAKAEAVPAPAAGAPHENRP